MTALALRLASLMLAGTVALFLAPRPAEAIDIKQVVSPGGIEAWLVEEHTIPVIAVSILFEGGAYHDPEGKAGLSYLLSATLDEGAADIPSEAFQRRLKDSAIELSFEADRDVFEGQMRTLSANRDEAFELLSLAVTGPRFDAGPVERMKRQLASQIARDDVRPDRQANQAWFRASFGERGYGMPLRGTVETMQSLGPDDLRAFHARLMTRDRLIIGVVGDIDAETLGPLLDKTFGGLPATSDLPKIAGDNPQAGPKLVTIEKDVPQTEIRFGLPGLTRDHPDFMAAYVMNYILGGGGFSSRLYEEVREKRGLTYSVYSYLYPLEGTGLFLGGAATRADRAAETLSVIRAEIERMAGEGPTEEELEAAKRYLTGAYPLRFDTSTKIARQLVAIQNSDLGIDYVNERNGLVEAVTIEDVRRLARDLLDPSKLLIVAVGSKASLEAIREGS